MNERILHLIETADLASRARFALGLLETADPCFVGLVVALLVLLGARMIAGQPALRRWGIRGAFAVFLLYAAAAWLRAGRPGAEAFPLLAVRSAVVAGAVLAAFWITLPVLGFLHRHLRIAVAAFLAYAGYALATADVADPEQLRLIAWRGVGVAGLALVIAWVLQPVGVLLRRALPERRRRPASPAAVAAPPPGEVVVSDEELRRRRERVRLKVEMNYVLIQPQVATALPPPTFKEFLNRYLGDHLPPDEVEENGRQLLSLLESRLSPAPVVESPATLEGLTRWLLDEQRRVEGLDLGPEDKRDRLADLQKEYAERAGRLLGEG